MGKNAIILMGEDVAKQLVQSNVGMDKKVEKDSAVFKLYGVPVHLTNNQNELKVFVEFE